MSGKQFIENVFHYSSKTENTISRQGETNEVTIWITSVWRLISTTWYHDHIFITLLVKAHKNCRYSVMIALKKHTARMNIPGRSREKTTTPGQ